MKIVRTGRDLSFFALNKELCGEDRAPFGCAQDKLLAQGDFCKELCGEDRARTDDLLAASQAL